MNANTETNNTNTTDTTTAPRRRGRRPRIVVAPTPTLIVEEEVEEENADINAEVVADEEQNTNIIQDEEELVADEEPIIAEEPPVCFVCENNLTHNDQQHYGGLCEDCYAQAHITQPDEQPPINNGDDEELEQEDYNEDNAEDDEVLSVESEGGLNRCCVCYEPSETITECGHILCEGCFGGIQQRTEYQRRADGRGFAVDENGRTIVRQVRPCPACRSNMTQVITRQLTDAQKVRRYETLLAENRRQEEELLANTITINNLRMNLAQVRLNTTAPVAINPQNGEPLNPTPRVAGGGGRTRQPRQPRTAQVVSVAENNLNGRPAGRNAQVILQEGQVLGDLHFASRPRARCCRVGENGQRCNRNTRRVCPTCRNIRVCAECNTCGDCA